MNNKYNNNLCNISSMFDKYIDITTQTNGKLITYHIEKKEVFIHDSSLSTKERYIYEHLGNIYIVEEFYTLDRKENIIRFSYTKYVNPKIIRSIEKKPNGEEIPVLSIETFDYREDPSIGSFSNITEIKSDLMNNIYEKKLSLKDRIFLKNKKALVSNV